MRDSRLVPQLPPTNHSLIAPVYGSGTLLDSTQVSKRSIQLRISTRPKQSPSIHSPPISTSSSSRTARHTTLCLRSGPVTSPSSSSSMRVRPYMRKATVAIRAQEHHPFPVHRHKATQALHRTVRPRPRSSQTRICSNGNSISNNHYRTRSLSSGNGSRARHRCHRRRRRSRHHQAPSSLPTTSLTRLQLSLLRQSQVISTSTVLCIWRTTRTMPTTTSLTVAARRRQARLTSIKLSIL